MTTKKPTKSERFLADRLRIDAKEREEALEFAFYLTETLGPDLEESGHTATSEDVMRAGYLLISYITRGAQ